MKKIAFILKFFQTKNFHGGGEKLFYNLIKRLSQEAYQVDIYCSKADEKRFEGINKIIEINANYDHLNPEVLENFYEKAKEYIKDENYDYVISENITPPIDITFIQGHSMVHRQKNVKTPLESLFYPFRKVKRERIKYQKKWIEQGYRKIFVPSEKVKKDLIQNFDVNPQKITVIYPGVDVVNLERPRHPELVSGPQDLAIPNAADGTLPCNSRFARKQEELQVRNDGRRIFTFGMSAVGFEKKGGYIFLKALKILKDNGYKFKAKIIYPKYPKNLFIKVLVKLFGIAKNVEFLDFQKDITSFYSSLDCIVMPSKEDSFGMVALEAMSLAKPVIISSNAGACEIINDGENGFIFEMKGAEKNLYKKMKYVIENKNNFEELASNAFETALKYNWERLYKDFILNLP
ncbi:MAG: glycosyltransferase family 4 protein [Candidatus Gastranaerophilaceae bacterium]|jgi:glycosyltransferase involved in cell wall biosynthesis